MKWTGMVDDTVNITLNGKLLEEVEYFKYLRVCTVEMSYLRGACGVTRWDGESNERCGMGSHADGVNCRVVEWVKRNTLRWFGHIERMGSEEFMKKMYVSESVGPSSRGRPPGRWRDRVKEYMFERSATREGGLDQASRECLDRERWRFFCHGHPLEGRSLRG